MRSKILTLVGGLGAIVLAMTAIWLWQNALYLSMGTTRPEVARWAVYSGAIALMAAGQVVLVTCVVGNLYDRGTFDKVFKLLAASVLMISLVSAVALGLAGR